jgi:excisionase family DNA binding protein
MELAISIDETAHRSGLGKTAIYEAVNCGDLPLRKAGRRSLILVTDLEAWINSWPTAKPLKLAA